MKTLTLWAALALAAAATDAAAKIFHSKEGALQLAFPGTDKVKPLHLFLTEENVRSVERLSGTQLGSKLVTVYVGHKGGRPTGFAIIDTHVVRTLPETFLTVLDLHGRIRAVHVLAFHEPMEYLPPRGWLRQFLGKELSAGLAVRQEIAGIAGATLSAYALTGGVRKALALYQVMLRPAIELAAGKVAKARDPG
jgi:hypothetical protein